MIIVHDHHASTSPSRKRRRQAGGRCQLMGLLHRIGDAAFDPG
jgi:hypothetical protein